MDSSICVSLICTIGKAFRGQRKQDQAETWFMLDFPSVPDDAPSGAPDELRYVAMEPDQLESIFKMRAPFLRQKKHAEGSVGPDFVPKRVRNFDHRFLGVLSDKNPRCCSRCHRPQSTRWNLRFKSSMMNSQTNSSGETWKNPVHSKNEEKEPRFKAIMKGVCG